MPEQLTSSLASPFSIDAETREAFDRDGFVQLSQVLDAEELESWRPLISELCHAKHANALPIEQRETYAKAFLQTTNLWRRDDRARAFVFSRRLAGIAAQLLGVKQVRIYHDQALFKEAGGGHTPWHADQYYWPLSSDRTVTAWIPLVDVHADMGPLSFAAGSHHDRVGEELAISDESEERLDAVVRERGYRVHEAPFACGDVSFHLGWNLHRAGPNRSAVEREVMTIIYMDADMELIEPTNPSRVNDARNWCPGIQPGQRCDSPLNPIVPWG